MLGGRREEAELVGLLPKSLRLLLECSSCLRLKRWLVRLGGSEAETEGGREKERERERERERECVC